MAYRDDEDLAFLSRVKSSDLTPLVKAIIYVESDINKGKHTFEGLSEKEIYKKNYPEHSAYWQDIAEEIQRFGANGVTTIFRGGKGILYKDVLFDVCEALGITHGMTPEARGFVIKAEDLILSNVLDEADSESDRDEIIRKLNPENQSTTDSLSTLSIFDKTMHNLFDRRLKRQGDKEVEAAVSWLPSWLSSPVTTAFNQAGPALRVTTPAIIHVALLRKKYAN